MFEKMEYRINVKMCRKKKIKQAKSLQTKIHTAYYNYNIRNSF